MNVSAEPQLLDFHDPRRLAPTSTRMLQRWQKDACEWISESWVTLLAEPGEIAPGNATAIRLAEALRTVADPGLGVVIQVGPENIPTLLAFSNRLVLALLEAMLGTPGEEWPQARELTPLELTMADVLFQSLCEGLSEGWPGQTPLPIRIQETCRPRRCRLFPPGTELIAARWEFKCGKSSEEALWLIPREEGELLLSVDEAAGNSTAADPKVDVLANIITQLPVEVTVDLGTTTLKMSEITELHVGDLVILDQAVSRPLTARIGDVPRWTGLPCRVGTRQAFDIRGSAERKAG